MTKTSLLLCLLVLLPVSSTQAQHRGGGFGGGYGYGFGNPFGFGLGFGLGYGFGMGGFGGRSSQIGYINQQALQNGRNATMGPVARIGYSEAAGAYYNHVHDVGSLERYDVGTRREMDARVGRFSDGPPPSRVRRERTPRVLKEQEDIQARGKPPALPSPQLPLASKSTTEPQPPLHSPPSMPQSSPKSDHKTESNNADRGSK